jgi:hypothetical protein
MERSGTGAKWLQTGMNGYFELLGGKRLKTGNKWILRPMREVKNITITPEILKLIADIASGQSRGTLTPSSSSVVHRARSASLPLSHFSSISMTLQTRRTVTQADLHFHLASSAAVDSGMRIRKSYPSRKRSISGSGDETFSDRSFRRS